ncbi:uncharacterized protein LOC109843601 isoform X2 [Asparagus officinalis]|uniref:uncharacterized protein LOC109843601 isoform X2 n=1 Tax=Asparagus officinalis TaxID=4686 RepID=UPI00098E7BCA|nr:uncharacterized protein LOC109843601 isoform X2 [Asparagus officinalis]
MEVDVAIIEVGLGGRLDPTNVVKLVWYYNNALGRPKKKKFIARAKSRKWRLLVHGENSKQASIEAEMKKYEVRNLFNSL